MRSSFFRVAIFLTTTLIITACTTNKAIDRSAYLRTLIGKVGFYKLPYTYDLYNGVAESKYTIDRRTMDSLFFDNGQIGGVFSDTTNFYCFLYYQVSDSHYPFLTTIDKKGNVIDKKNISIGACRGLTIDIDSCIDRVVIDRNLEIDLFFKVRGTAETSTSDTTFQTVKVCNTIIGKGRVTKEGKIEITKSDLQQCE